VVSNWIKRVYTILVWNTISGSSNLDICCYHCLILTLIFHLKVFINFFFFIFIIIIINNIIGIIIIIIITTITITITITISTTTTTTIIVIFIVIIVTIVVVLLLFIIYTINLLVVRPRSCRVIYYFDTPTLGRRHQSFGHVMNNVWLKIKMRCIRGKNYAWGCTCSCGIHVVSKCSHMIILIILIMKRLIIFFGHIFWKWWGYPTKSTT